MTLRTNPGPVLTIIPGIACTDNGGLSTVANVDLDGAEGWCIWKSTQRAFGLYQDGKLSRKGAMSPESGSLFGSQHVVEIVVDTDRKEVIFRRGGSDVGKFTIRDSAVIVTPVACATNCKASVTLSNVTWQACPWLGYDAPQSAVLSISGAAVAEVNGFYAVGGVLNGRANYWRLNSDGAIDSTDTACDLFWHEGDNIWGIRMAGSDNTAAQALYFAHANPKGGQNSPPTDGWRALRGEPPAPTIRYHSQDVRTVAGHTPCKHFNDPATCQHAVCLSLDPGPTTGVDDSSSGFLVIESALVDEEWYWGKIDDNDAVALLKDKGDGTFLVRQSTSKPGTFSVSLVLAKNVIHIRIDNKEDGFALGPTRDSYPSISDLVKHSGSIVGVEHGETKQYICVEESGVARRNAPDEDHGKWSKRGLDVKETVEATVVTNPKGQQYLKLIDGGFCPISDPRPSAADGTVMFTLVPSATGEKYDLKTPLVNPAARRPNDRDLIVKHGFRELSAPGLQWRRVLRQPAGNAARPGQLTATESGGLEIDLANFESHRVSGKFILKLRWPTKLRDGAAGSRDYITWGQVSNPVEKSVVGGFERIDIGSIAGLRSEAFGGLAQSSHALLAAVPSSGSTKETLEAMMTEASFMAGSFADTIAGPSNHDGTYCSVECVELWVLSPEAAVLGSDTIDDPHSAKQYAYQIDGVKIKASLVNTAATRATLADQRSMLIETIVPKVQIAGKSSGASTTFTIAEGSDEATKAIGVDFLPVDVGTFWQMDLVALPRSTDPSPVYVFEKNENVTLSADMTQVLQTTVQPADFIRHLQRIFTALASSLGGQSVELYKIEEEQVSGRIATPCDAGAGCKEKETCKFTHPGEAPVATMCKFGSNCRNPLTCKYAHDGDVPPLCQQGAACPKKATCKFSHPGTAQNEIRARVVVLGTTSPSGTHEFPWSGRCVRGALARQSAAALALQELQATDPPQFWRAQMSPSHPGKYLRGNPVLPKCSFDTLAEAVKAAVAANIVGKVGVKVRCNCLSRVFQGESA